MSKPHRKTAKRKSTVIKGDTIKTVQTVMNRCNVCGAGFAQLKNLTRHLQTHSDADINELNRFACTTCDELFTEWVLIGSFELFSKIETINQFEAWRFGRSIRKRMNRMLIKQNRTVLQSMSPYPSDMCASFAEGHSLQFHC